MAYALQQARNRIGVSSVRPGGFPSFPPGKFIERRRCQGEIEYGASQRQLSPDPVGEFGLGWLIGHVRGSGDDDDPMMMSQQFALVVVPPPLVFVGAMMIAVIFDGDAEFGPSEIECYRRTIAERRAGHCVICHGSWKPVLRGCDTGL